MIFLFPILVQSQSKLDNTNVPLINLKETKNRKKGVVKISDWVRASRLMSNRELSIIKTLAVYDFIG